MSSGLILDETALVQLLKSHDQAAFRKLFDRYRQPVFVYSLNLLKSREAAEENVQDVFMKIWQMREKLDPQKSFKAFVFTIARNTAFNVLAKAASDEKLRERIFYASHELAQEADYSIRQDECKALRKQAMNALPEKRRQIFKMSRKDGMTYEEIGRELGISVHTVRNQMSKALETMRLILHEHDQAV
ncbi:RNA polymerase sigma-70 factor [Flavobacterium silvaticum]|uniref:RNA polymerase sigma-70 factor n=1 Tax=Flavobacterium silvaticum TaxID=1852020 RepID=A0A972JFU9_9FLAO|nr:RNA polymerase sigma-70 factor [Flavobacterium silvaticum]NMH27536.1 RNA polymerase sigma-70 factor [Flavobacterium silvaticum]